MRFSERYGYVKPADVLKRGCLEHDAAVSLCNCYDHLAKWFNKYDVDRGNRYNESYVHLEESIWCFFMNQRRDDFYVERGHMIAATYYLLSEEYEWYYKMDLIEYTVRVLRQVNKGNNTFNKIVDAFVNLVNDVFKRFNYAYRVVGEQVVELTDEKEIAAIEEAMAQPSAIQTHLSDALKHLSSRPVPDYRNSIKESISAVEFICREITGKTTLGDALKELEKKGVKIPTFIKSGIEKLYVYTNDKRTGIRHALMDDSEVPEYDEAKFMLVACCAFINYLQGKRV